MKKPVALIILIVSSLASMAQQTLDGQKLVYYQRYRSAIEALQAQIKTTPSDAGAWYWLSQAFIGSGNWQAGKDSLLQAPALVISTPLYQVAYGHFLLKANNRDSAAWYFNAAMNATRQKDISVLSAIARAQVEAKAGDASSALDVLERALKRDKKDPVLYSLQGDAYRKLGNGTEAYRSYEAALNKDKSYAAASYQLGKIFVAQKNPEVYLSYFEQALKADPLYAPAYYELYYHYYFKDVAKAMDYFRQYQERSDYDKQNDYQLADMLYLTHQYQPAIDKAQQLIATDGDTSAPRLYKLLAYCYLGIADTSRAMINMQTYFRKEADSNYVAKDFDLMATLYGREQGREDSAIYYYSKAADMETNMDSRYAYYKKLGDLTRSLHLYSAQAGWLEKYYADNARATNLDLFNWGLAHFRAEEYREADTVFGMYTEKYPDQGFGYYWRARSNALLDSTMESGIAIPHYNKLIEVLEKDTSNATNKKWLVEAYGYVAAYETNKEKDYDTAIEYLEKVLTIDPANKDAQRYLSILEKNKDAQDNKK